jgi:hypothetical protein
MHAGTTRLALRGLSVREGPGPAAALSGASGSTWPGVDPTGGGGSQGAASGATSMAAAGGAPGRHVLRLWRPGMQVRLVLPALKASPCAEER